MFGIMVVMEVLRKSENLAKTLRGINVTATGALKCIQKLISTL